MKISEKNIKTIAVINLGFVGDIVNASAVCVELKRKFPSSKLVFITVPKSEEISKQIPGVDEVFVFDKDVKHKGPKIFPWAFTFRFKNKIDMVILLNETFRSAILAFLLGAKIRVGHNSEGRGFLLTHTVPWPEEEKDFKVHISEIYMRNLKAIDLYNPDYELKFNYAENDNTYVDNLLNNLKCSDYELIGLCPCARYGCKDWIPEEAAKFINYINQNPKQKVVVIGQESGKIFADSLRNLGITDFIDLTCQTNIGQLAALISKFKILVSVDTAPMHLGFALKTPTVALFVQGNYGKWGPRNLEINRLIHEPGGNKASTLIKEFNNLYNKLYGQISLEISK